MLHVLIDGKTEYSTQLNRVFDDNYIYKSFKLIPHFPHRKRNRYLGCNILSYFTDQIWRQCALNKWFFSWPVLSKPAMMARMAYSNSSWWQKEYSMAVKELRKTLATLPDHSKKIFYILPAFLTCVFIFLAPFNCNN